MSERKIVTAPAAAGAHTDDARYYEWQARRLLRDLADYEFYAAEVARCNDRLQESYTRECGCNAIRYDKIVAGRNIGGERPTIDHEREIVRRDEIRQRMIDAQERMAAVNRMLSGLDDTTRAMAIDKYQHAEFDLIMEQRYDMTRSGIRKKILTAVENYCRNVDELR